MGSNSTILSKLYIYLQKFYMEKFFICVAWAFSQWSYMYFLSRLFVNNLLWHILMKNNLEVLLNIKKTNKTDMFQIGRSTEPLIDFIVVDTIPGPKDNLDELLTQSTISRFACRILVERSSHRARVYAAGFDGNRRIFLGVSILLN